MFPSAKSVAPGQRLQLRHIRAKLFCALGVRKRLHQSRNRRQKTSGDEIRPVGVKGMTVVETQPGRPRFTSRAIRLFVLSMPTVALAQLSRVPDPGVPLYEGVPASATHNVEQPVTYVFDAEAGRTYLIVVEQQGLDFVVTVESPEGSSRSYNSPLKRDERELVLLETATAGLYRITVDSNEPTRAKGSHVVRINVIEPAAQDPRAMRAWSLMSEGAAANAAGTRSRADEAVVAYEKAAELWRLLEDSRNQAQALFSIAILEYWVRYDWSRSAALAAVAADLYHALDEPRLEANAMLLQAMALIESIRGQGADEAQSNFAMALTLLARSYRICEPFGDTYELARREYFTGLAYNNMGELGEAKQAWETAALDFATANEWMDVFYVRLNLAVTAIQEGHNSRAIETLESIIADPLHEADPSFRAAVLDNLAAAYRTLGFIDEALGTYSAALEVHRQLEDRHGEASSLGGIAGTYFAAGELDLAAEYARQARDAADAEGVGLVSAMSRTTLGDIAFLKSEYAKARSFHEAALDATSSRLLRSYRHVLVARDLTALGRHAEAMEHSKAALALAEEARSPLALADARQSLGADYLATADVASAVALFDDALALYRSLGLEGSQADVHHRLALAARTNGNLDEALQQGALSLNHIEALRERVSAPELRALYGAARRGYYETQIDLLMARHQQTGDTTDQYLLAALTTSERARARLTIDLLGEASIDLAHGVDGQLAERRRQLFNRLADGRAKQDALLSEDSFGADQRSQLDRVITEMASTENELNLVETELRHKNPRYASFAAPDTLPARDIQRLVDPGSVLLQYSLGAERSFVWVVTTDSIRGIELANEGTIEAAARSAYESIKAPYGTHTRARLRDLALLVIEPVADLLDGKKRLLIAADGALQYVPFSALPVRSGDETEPLIVSREVVSLPSLSVLAAQRARGHAKAPEKTLAVFADPVVADSDTRFERSRGVSAATEAAPYAATRRASTGKECRDLDCRAQSPAAGRLERIAATGVEARAIAELVPPENRLVKTGFDASRNNVLGYDLSQYRIVHFATHGLVDSQYPALSALALSSFDETGNPRNGLIRLDDIYDMKLNADLVVLSACETALGEEVRGEGLIGLTQGFMYAGARSLAVSLWQVPDRATAELMIRFYGFMFRDGQAAAQALRNAQLSIAAEARWSDPYYWGAFELVGDWR
jgi:CHAT domain-containing protein/tetratricopeptide (TPR) repeat protein